MFYTQKQREEIYAKFYEQERLILDLKIKIRELEDSIKAPYGTRKDGAPRAKPGIKTGQRKVVTK